MYRYINVSPLGTRMVDREKGDLCAKQIAYFEKRKSINLIPSKV